MFRNILLATSLFLMLSAGSALAQAASGYSVNAEADPPRTELSSEYEAVARRYFAETKATYASEIEGDLASGIRVPGERARGERSFTFGGGSGLGVFAAVLGFVLAILLFLKFGGAGVLLSREPRDIKKRQEAPEAWAIGAAEADLDTDALIRLLKSMNDKREALIRLLRHCLLHAAEDSETRFARSDTEREAFARLPEDWRHREALGALLKHTELAHYGGRPVSETTFADLLEIAQHMLRGKGRSAHA